MHECIKTCEDEDDQVKKILVFLWFRYCRKAGDLFLKKNLI